jgi:hypothetical protein
MTARKRGIKTSKTGMKPPETTDFDWPRWTRAAEPREDFVCLALAANQHPTVIAKHCGFTPSALYYYKRLIDYPPSEKKRSRSPSDTQKRIVARRNLVRILAKKTVKAAQDTEGTRVKFYSSAPKITAALRVKHDIVASRKTVLRDLNAVGLVSKRRGK